MKQVTLKQNKSSMTFVRFDFDELLDSWLPICRDSFIELFGDPTHVESVTISTTAFKGSRLCKASPKTFQVSGQTVWPSIKMQDGLRILLGKETPNYTFFFRFNYSENETKQFLHL